MLTLFTLVILTALQLRADDRKKKKDDISKIKAYVIHDALQGVMLVRVIALKCKDFLTIPNNDSFDVTKYKDEVMHCISFPNKRTVWDDVDSRGALIIWHTSGKVDTVCLCYLPEIMINHVVYVSDNSKGESYYPYDNLVYLLKKVTK